ncbi:MAG: DNA polymerase III subunit alpha, partial [Rhodobacteraceae bacterium]|nr:DNA polymerase III subunit alpha [Paracoccaceae bacterium]
LKTPAEMTELFADLPEAIENTCEIARRCQFNTSARNAMLPKFSDDEDEDLRRFAEKGLAWRLETQDMAATREDYEKRLHYELDVIRQKGFSGYYLIVHDFVVWAKEQDIPVGPGRGSGVGSLVAFALRITNLDPVRYSLLFERFLNPERDSAPDFDIDFCQESRGRVVDYVCQKYGSERVAQIITFGTLGAKAGIRDLGRILRIPRGKLVALSDEVDPTRRLRDQIDANPVLAEEVRSSADIRDLFNHIDKVEGLPRNTSRHPAGVVIGNQPLQQILPLQNDDPEQMPTTQFDMKWTEKAGLVKMDFLGLQTLTAINHTLTTLREDGIEIDLDTIGYDDPEVFALYASGYTLGVFQVESGGMVDSLRMMKPNRIEDIIALLALYRPGPMANIPDYCQVKNGEKRSKRYHPLIDDLLDETNGIIVYQEQVMEIARRMAGYTRGHADILRKAMGKKLPAEMAREKPRFIDGAREKGVSARVAENVWKLLEKFAEYGFNKAHAAGYAATSYQTAYLKCKHPAAFMASAMTNERELTDKITTYARELNRLGIDLEPPCINRSVVGFRAEGKVIHYALDAIKGVGTEVARAIVEARGETPFADIFDFARRADLQFMNRGAVEQMVLAGVFDALSPNRQAVYASIDRLFAYRKNAVEQDRFHKDSLFDSDDEVLSQPELLAVDDWSPSERLANEIHVLGMYITGHPLDDYQAARKALKCHSIAEVTAITRKGPDALEKSFSLKVAGVLASVKHRQSKTNKRMAIVKLADQTDEIECFVFPQDLEDTPMQLTENICVSAFLNVKEHNDRLMVNASLIRPLSQRPAALPHKTIGIYYNVATVPARILTLLGRKADSAKPDLDITLRFCPVYEGMNNQVEIEVPQRFQVCRATREAIRKTDGVVNISVS